MSIEHKLEDIEIIGGIQNMYTENDNVHILQNSIQKVKKRGLVSLNGYRSIILMIIPEGYFWYCK